MIIEYHRPETEADALALLLRTVPKTVALGGGTVLSKTKEDVAVVDLQSLGWNSIRESATFVFTGGCVTLEALRTHFGADSAIGHAITIEAGKNIRCMATLGGTLASNGGRSPFLTALLALGVELIVKPGEEGYEVGEWLDERNSFTSSKVISSVFFSKNATLAFDSIGRSPLDLPTLCCAVARNDQHQVRIAFGGFGEAPILAFTGTDQENYLPSVEKALNHSGDQWASAEYRLQTGRTIVQRLYSAGA
jgi:CO/xanthine dehydrogenase FAD-binding subunit